MATFAVRWIGFLICLFGVMSCGQNYNSNTNDNGGELGIDCATTPALCEAYTAMRDNHCFECHGWSGYRTDAAWISSGLVIKNDPSNSRIITKLKNAGGNMPQNFSPMTSSEYTALRTWIQNM